MEYYYLERENGIYIEEIVEKCKQIFNSALGENFLNEDNLKVAFLNFNNGVSVYEGFCERFFPKYLEENYTKPGYMKSFVAQAFVNGDIYGMLISLEFNKKHDEWYQIILHEMSHIFCVSHEIGGDDFFLKYCADDKIDVKKRGIIGVGYTVWREFIADDIAAQICPFTSPLSMDEIREAVRGLDEKVDAENPATKMIVSQILACVFRNTKIRQAESVITVFKSLEKNRIFASKVRNSCYHEVIGIIFEQLSRDDYWKINLEFIEKLGLACVYWLV